MKADMETTIALEEMSAAELKEMIWAALWQTAVAAGLDHEKFGDIHDEIIGHIADFLTESPHSAKMPVGWSKFLPMRVREESNGRLTEPRRRLPRPQTIPPIILCGIPGTGKTTFLSLLDIVLRHRLHLPDNLKPEMQKGSDQTHHLQKRLFNGQPTSLLSVRKWTQLLHFFMWDTAVHRINQNDLQRFIQTTLVPMRVLFTDEVEMTGYSPTLPDLARQGILVVGSSNQQTFPQLSRQLVPPRIYPVAGTDMRQGNPMDAVVTADDPAWSLFAQLQAQPPHRFQELPYHAWQRGGATVVLVDFATAVNAPLLEAEWLAFFQTVWQASGHLVLLFAGFDLDTLQKNYNAIIRFIALFDAIEQLGVGVLVRQKADAVPLSRQSLLDMKTAVEQAPDVSQEIKEKTAVGLDRATSRIGQAAMRAQHFIA
jgi:hypothetical protein